MSVTVCLSTRTRGAILLKRDEDTISNNKTNETQKTILLLHKYDVKNLHRKIETSPQSQYSKYSQWLMMKGENNFQRENQLLQTVINTNFTILKFQNLPSIGNNQ
jgi:hypothetical protein